ncbi:MAG TPA: 30S ribosomal protein S5 [bacterium]|nr:30S ribosomal protein S5 [bacterium]
METKKDNTVKDFHETVINIRRVAKVVKGGRRFSFSTMVVVGDGRGKVGLGIGKSKEVSSSILKAVQSAKKSLIFIPYIETGTIPYAILGKYGAGRVLLKPASEGTGVIAGGAVRAVVEASGIKNILSKSLGSDNSINIAKATFSALKQLMNPEKLKELKGLK